MAAAKPTFELFSRKPIATALHCMLLLALRATPETRQIGIYFAAVVLADIFAWRWPASTGMASAIDPLLALMPLVTNFVAVPLLVALLLPWMPQDPLLRVGVLLVLLTLASTTL